MWTPKSQLHSCTSEHSLPSEKLVACSPQDAMFVPMANLSSSDESTLPVDIEDAAQSSTMDDDGLPAMHGWRTVTCCSPLAALVDYLRELFVTVHTDVGGNGTVTMEQLVCHAADDVMFQSALELTADSQHVKDRQQEVRSAFMDIEIGEDALDGRGSAGSASTVGFDSFLRHALRAPWHHKLLKAFSIDQLIETLRKTRKSMAEKESHAVQLQNVVDMLQDALEHKHMPLLERVVAESETRQQQLLQAKEELRRTTEELSKLYSNKGARRSIRCCCARR
eukprot:SAG31_NODE_6874_length_1863_cov_2.475624_1_plen_280_part_00